MDEIVHLLPDQENYVIQTKLPSYINVFLSEVPQDSLLLHKVAISEMQDTVTSFMSPVAFDANVTGSPLEFSAYSLRCEDTVLNVKNNWSSDEENHIPVSLEEARMILSKYMLKTKNIDHSVWLLCNGCDPRKTLLLFGKKKDSWFTRSMALYKGKFSLSNLQSQIASLSVIGKNLMAWDALCVYNLFESNDFDGGFKISAEITWDHPVITVPKEVTSTTLILEGIVGSENSQAYPLWCHLCLLRRYMDALQECKHKGQVPFLSPESNKLPVQDIQQILQILHNEGSEINVLSDLAANGCQFSGTNLLFELVRQVAEGRRPGHDMSDKIWLLLADSRNISHMTDILNEILKALRRHQLKPQISLTNRTFLAKTITAKDLSTVVELSEKEALKILVEAGIEKLRQDYMYIFKNLGVECGMEFADLVAGDSIAKATSNFSTMMQLHATLDMLLIAQSSLDLCKRSLNTLAHDLFVKCSSNVQSLQPMLKNLVTVKVPIKIDDIAVHLPSFFVSFRLTSRRTDKDMRDTNVLLFTMKPIFPPSVFKLNESPDEETMLEEQYYYYQMLSSSDKLM